ncbi:MAG: hypothetical protein H6Q48_215 [Deltaproteobacteria bacterium]|jgi:hypothetical protein|nr:hypothetical protein [Deltaproteobacteria bacterium]
MSRQRNLDNDLRALDDLIKEITVDAYGEDEVPLPADGFVIGEPVSVLEMDYDGNERRGLTARCRREDGSEHVVAALELVFPKGSIGARYMAAYRRWFGLDPYPSFSSNRVSRSKQRRRSF